MPGLPFVSLDEAANQEEQSLIARQNQQVAYNAQELTRDRAAGRMGVEMMPTAQPQAGAARNLDPFALLTQKYDPMETQLLSQRDALKTRINASIRQPLDTSFAKYKLDMAALDRADLDADQKRQHNDRVNTEYQKHWLDIKGKIQPDLDELDAQTEKAVAALKFDRAQTQTRLQTIQGMIDEGTVPKSAGRRKQFAVLGYEFPESDFEEKVQTPRQQISDLTMVVDAWTEVLKERRLNPKTGRLEALVPMTEWDTGSSSADDKNWRPMTEMQRREYSEILLKLPRVTNARSDLYRQLLNRSVSDLSGTMMRGSVPSPAAQIVLNQKTQPAADVSSLSDEELRRIAEGR